LENTGKFPCGICKNGSVWTNSYRCTACNSRMHKKCSSIRRDYKVYLDITVKSVVGDSGQSEVFWKILLGLGKLLECVGKLCYLSDIIGASGRVEEASAARVRSAWAKFWDFDLICFFNYSWY